MSSNSESSKPVRVMRYPLRVAKQIYNLPRIREEVRALREGFKKVADTNEATRIEALHLRNKAEAVEKNQEDILHRMQRLDERLSDVIHQLAIMNRVAGAKKASGNAAEKSSPSSDSQLVADEHLLDNFYVEFERWFRGNDEEIKERQKVYLPYFTESKINSKKFPAVDIGCGRGEFVQLLVENGIRAIGLDLNKSMVDLVKEKKLEAVEADALSFLREQPTGSLMAITGFHIVEHIPFLDLVHIFDECYRVLAPGGFVVFETPNPENLIVGACNFYADPSHLHPLPPAFLDFTLKTRGFAKTEVKRLHPIKPDVKHSDKLVQEMAERIYGPQDYAVIAHK